MRDKYNLNTLPASLAALDDCEYGKKIILEVNKSYKFLILHNYFIFKFIKIYKIYKIKSIFQSRAPIIPSQYQGHVLVFVHRRKTSTILCFDIKA